MKYQSFLLALLGFLLFACNDDDETPNDQPSSSNPVGIVENVHMSGQTVQADFIGRITDKSGNGISGAIVSIGNLSTTTNSLGFYQIENAAVDLKTHSSEEIGNLVFIFEILR